VGTCTGMSVAVSVAPPYTHHVYGRIAVIQRTGGRKKSVEIGIHRLTGALLLEVRKRFNGAQAEHKIVP